MRVDVRPSLCIHWTDCPWQLRPLWWQTSLAWCVAVFSDHARASRHRPHAHGLGYHHCAYGSKCRGASPLEHAQCGPLCGAVCWGACKPAPPPSLRPQSISCCTGPRSFWLSAPYHRVASVWVGVPLCAAACGWWRSGGRDHPKGEATRCCGLCCRLCPQRSLPRPRPACHPDSGEGPLHATTPRRRGMVNGL